MKTLLIVRHAKAVPKHLSLSDHDRPLDKVGEEDALHMGKLIEDLCDLLLQVQPHLELKQQQSL